MRYSLPTLGLAATLALAACDDEATPPEVTSQLNADIAEVVADAALEDLGIMAAAAPLRGPLAAAANNPRGDLERDRTVTFYDEGGAEQEEYDEETTASLRVVTTVEGSIERNSLSASVDRFRDMTATGLLGEETERTWNGAGVTEVARTRVSDDFGTRTYEFEAEAEVEGVVRAVDKVAQPWPLAGTITRWVVVVIVNGPNGDEVRERTTVLTFNGTQYATLEVDGETFEVDLAARQAERASRKKGGT